MYASTTQACPLPLLAVLCPIPAATCPLCRLISSWSFVAPADLEFSVNITATKAVQLDDISVRLAPTNHTAQMMCGMGTEGSYLHDIGWNWDMTMGNNRLWIGRVESGVRVSTIAGPDASVQSAAMSLWAGVFLPARFRHALGEPQVILPSVQRAITQ